MTASAQLERFVWDGPYAGSFEPAGAAVSHGTEGPRSGRVLAARFVIGFQDMADSSGALDEMIQVARDVRGRQTPHMEPMVIAQGGFYRHRDPTGHYRAEAGGQVVVIDVAATSRKQFEVEMIELAETIARWFGQRIVVLELQQDAVTQVVHHVSP
jgi:hypothetical protein